MKNYLVSTAAPGVGAHRAHRHGNENDRRDCGESDGRDAAPSGRALHRHDPLHARTEHCFCGWWRAIYFGRHPFFLFRSPFFMEVRERAVHLFPRSEPDLKRAGGGANQVKAGTPVRAGEAA